MRGWFLFNSITAGTWRVEAGRPGLSTIRRLVEVVENSEVRLDLALEPLVTLTLAVDPIPPAHEVTWMAQLAAHAGGTTHETVIDQGGLAFFIGLEPGGYRLTIVRGADAKGGVHHQDIEVTGDQLVEVGIPWVPVRGRVLLGNHPLAEADIELQTGGLDSWTFQSDDDGRFEGIVRRLDRGVVFATVTTTEPPIHSRWRVRTYKLEDDGLSIELVMSKSEITGWVSTASRSPAAQATVVAEHLLDQVVVHTAQTGTDGRFRLAGLLPAPYVLRIRSRNGTGAVPVEVDLRDSAPSEVRLELVESRPFTLAFTTPAGQPLAGARINVVTSRPAVTTTGAVTGPDGRAKIRLPRTAQRAVLDIDSASSPLESVCIELPAAPDNELAFTVANTSGKVRLDTKADPALPPLSAGSVWLVNGRGGLLPTQRAVGSDRGVAAGSYAAVYHAGPSWRLADRICEQQERPGVSWQVLATDSSLRLTIDLRSQQRRELR